MAGDKNVSNLATALQGNEYIEATQGGVRVIITPEQLKSYVGDIPDGGDGVTEEQLNAAIASEAGTRAAADSSEATTRGNADTALGLRIDDEIAARISAVSTEASTRAGADSTLNTAILSAVSQAAADTATEASARIAADAAEVTARNAAIAVETANRISGDNAESSARTTAIATAVSNLVNGAPSNLNTLSEIATSIENDPAFGTTIRAAIASAIAANDAMIYKGDIDCSANPNYPTANCGWTYRVSVAGKIGGASGVTVDAGDILTCLADGTAAGNQATVGASWTVIQTNLVGALTTAAIGVSIQAYDATLATIAALTGANGKMIYFSGTDSATLIDATTDGRALLGAASVAAQVALLGLTIGTNVQGYSANLAAWSAVNPSAYLNTAGIAAAYQPLSAVLTATTASFTATLNTKLSGIAAGATANSSDATLLARANHTGTQSADTLIDGVTNKAFLATERTKLSGIATGATANSADATLLARANHTGSQLASTISDFSTAADLRIVAAAKVDRGGDTMTGTLMVPTLGIGASFTPSTILHTRTTAGTADHLFEGNATTRVIITRYSADASGPINIVRKARGSIAAPAYPNQNDSVGSFNFQMTDGATPVSCVQFAATVIAAVPSATDSQSRLEIFAAPAGGATPTAILRLEHATGMSMFGANPVIDENRIHRLRSYTVGTLPSAATAAGMIYVSNESGGATPAFSDGTNWRRVADRAIVT